MATKQDSVYVTQDVVEVLFPYITPDPSTVTGAGVTQDVVEVLFPQPASAYVTQDVVEVLFSIGLPTNVPTGPRPVVVRASPVYGLPRAGS